MDTSIEEKLYHRNLVDVYEPLKKRIDATGNWELKEELEQIQGTHKTMLRFVVMGIDDPNGNKLYDSLIRQIYILYDRTERLLRMAGHPSDRYTTTLKTVRDDSLPDNVLIALETLGEKMQRLGKERANGRESIFRHDMDETQEQHEEVLIHMFNQVWTSDVWRKSEYETAISILNSSQIRIHDIAIFTSAVTLSLTEMFDFNKLMFLLDAYLHQDTEVNQRALTGIVLAIRKYEKRFHAFPEISTRLSFYKEDPRFIKELYTIHLQLQFCHKTESISDKMKNDIIPTILKSKNFKQTEYGIQEIDTELTKNGEDPDWYNKGDEEKATKKMREMADLQFEGADVYMSTFRHMKSYPFFNQTAHWFYPFYMEHPSIRQVQRLLESGSGTLMRVVLEKSPFSNSDKYSFCFMLNSIGALGQDMISQQLSEQMPQDEDIRTMLEISGDRKEKTSDVSRRYIYDLYRFFKIYPFHHQFQSPFADKEHAFTPLNSEALSFMNEYADEKMSLAEFFMRKEFYGEAERLFRSFNPQKSEEDVDIWQKIGFCQQKQKNYQEAYRSYAIAEELCPDSKWTLTHLAYVASVLKEYKTASRCYDKLLDNDPDNMKLLMKKAEMLISTEHFNEALPITYKMYYLDDKSIKCRKTHAKVLLMTGNDVKKAEQLLRKIVEEEPEDELSKMNLAHTVYAQGDTTGAYKLYKQLYEKYRQNDDEMGYSNAFWNTLPMDNQSVFDISKMGKMYDAIRMNDLGIQ